MWVSGFVGRRRTYGQPSGKSAHFRWVHSFWQRTDSGSLLHNPRKQEEEVCTPTQQVQTTFWSVLLKSYKTMYVVGSIQRMTVGTIATFWAILYGTRRAAVYLFSLYGGGGTAEASIGDRRVEIQFPTDMPCARGAPLQATSTGSSGYTLRLKPNSNSSSIPRSLG
jgi:hypothetical protein